MKNVLAMLLRAKTVILLSFVLLFGTLLILLALKPDKYEAHMTFLIRSQRTEDLVSGDPSQKALQQESETEERINSEIALLGSAEVLKAVVLDVGIENDYLSGAKGNRAVAIEKASRDLGYGLVIKGLRKSAIIEVSYISTNRDRAKAVLDALSKEYLRQYTKLHSSGGASTFYRAESQALETDLQKEQDERVKLLTESSYSLLPEAQQRSFGRITDLEKARADTETLLAETVSRLQKVTNQQGANPNRVTTQRRVAANSNLVGQLSAKLTDQQNKLTELRSKFVETDTFVTELKQEVADTKAALAAAQSIHSEDVTTDVSLVRQTLDGEANQLNQTLAGLLSRKREIERQLVDEKSQIAGSEQGRNRVDELTRHIKVLQDSVDLYRGRALAATAAEEMDPEKFSNVVEASYPTVPVLPMSSRFNVNSSFLLSFFLSLGIGLAWDARKQSQYKREGARFPVFERAAAR